MVLRDIKTIKEAKNLEIILKKYSKYYDSSLRVWNIPSIEMKNMISEVWNVSKEINKNKK